MERLNLDDRTFRGEIKNGTTLVHFSAPHVFDLAVDVDVILDELSTTLEKELDAPLDWLRVASLDTDANQTTATAEHIEYLPTLVLYVDGAEDYRYPDIQDGDLYALPKKLGDKLKEHAPKKPPARPPKP